MPDPIDDFESVFDEVLASDPDGVDDGIDADEDTDVDDGTDADDSAADDDEPDEEDPDDESDNSSSFDWTSHKDELVTLKISGQDVSVPLGEALNGYLRQADYTRKTQELASEKQYVDWSKNLKQALETDPASVIKTLAEAYKVSLTDDDDYESDDPDIQRLTKAQRELAAKQQEIDQFREQQELAAMQAQIAQEVATFQANHADFKPEVILPICLEEGLTITQAYKQWKGDQAIRMSEADRIAAQKAAEKSALVAKKRSNAQRVSTGTGFRGTSVESDDAFDNVGDMFADAIIKSRKTKN